MLFRYTPFSVSNVLSLLPVLDQQAARNYETLFQRAIVTFALAVPLDELRDDTTVMRRLAISPVFIDIGVIAATLSSAIASILGAPRTLQRLAADRLIPRADPLGGGGDRRGHPNLR